MRKKLQSLFVAAMLCATAANANEPVTATVVAYNPAPGQFTNALPKFEEGKDSVSMAALANEKIAAKSMISLGAFGGNVVFKLSSPIQNVTDEYDFSIFGNSFEGSSEPGIVSVSVDANGNGLADDTWYELEGAAWDSVGVIKKYTITYYKPTAEMDAAKGNHEKYIQWKDNQGAEGWVAKNGFHTQSYYPLWYGDSITFTGTKLPNNCYDQSGKGTYWVLPGYEWGYVDNRPNADVDKNSFKIDHARNAEGELANLTHIDFIKVHNGMYAINGWLGEASTEVQEIKIISPKAIITSIEQEKVTNKYYINSENIIFENAINSATIYEISGRIVRNIAETSNTIDISNLNNGIYILRTENETIKFIK